MENGSIFQAYKKMDGENENYRVTAIFQAYKKGARGVWSEERK